MSRLACYLAGSAIVLYALRILLGLFAPSWGAHLGGWVGFLAFVAAVLFFILGFRWVKRRILWRLRNRLIVTYMFIGVIPAVLLVAMGLITLYGLGGQFAVFLVTSEIHSQLRSMAGVNDAVSNALAARLERGEAPAAESLAGLRKRDPAWQRRHVCAWYGNKPLPLCNDFGGASLTYPEFMKGSFQDMVHDGGQLYLRVGSSMQVAGNTLTVVTGEPFDKDLVSKIASDLGEITLYTPAIKKDSGSKPPAPASSSAGSSLSATADQDRNKLVITKGNANDREELPARFTVGAVPESSGSFDREITFGTPLPVTEWKTGAPQQVLAVLQVTTRPAVLYAHLFAALGEFVRGVIYILLGIGIVFAIIELIALIIGTRMTRTVTGAVAELHNATRHVDRGDFSHRIPIRSNDQLSDLALSFNSMTASIEKLILEQKEKQRLENELTIAQEVQAQLFPRQISQLESLEV
ncbi:MAG: hypothetical protein DMG99_11915, partial [Acidobacteria bacterium]